MTSAAVAQLVAVRRTAATTCVCMCSLRMAESPSPQHTLLLLGLRATQLAAARALSCGGLPPCAARSLYSSQFDRLAESKIWSRC